MQSSQPPSRSRFLEIIRTVFVCFLHRRPLRQLVCFAIIVNLLIFPGPVLLLRQLPVMAAASANAATSVAADSARYASGLLKWLLGIRPAAARQESLADRISRITQIRVSPPKLVVYVGEHAGFSALPLDSSGAAVDGARLTWTSDSTQHISVDEAGNVTGLQPGLAWLSCTAGPATGRAPVLVLLGSRPNQTFAQWAADQRLLAVDGTITSRTTGIGWLPTLLDRLAPTAQAQNYGSLDYLWQDSRNLVGNPRNRPVEPTKFGSVLPESSNFCLGTQLVNFPGRGLNLNLGLYYNSQGFAYNGSYVVSNYQLPAFPGPGFSLGFGCILTYMSSFPPYDTGFMLIDRDGTRRYMGHGDSYSAGTFTTQDGSHITYFGTPLNGGTLTYPDGTWATISVVNNYLLPTQIVSKNGDYITVAYKDASQGYNALAIDFITDTLGRTIQFFYDPTTLNLSYITVPMVGGFSSQIRFTYTAYGVGAVYLLTGTGYVLSYTNYGIASNVSFRRQMSYPYSNGVESASVSFNYPASLPANTFPVFTTRTESPNSGTYTYSSSTTSGAITFTIARPDSSTLNLTRSTASGVANGLMTQTEIKNSSGGSMAKSVFTYANDPGGFPQVQTGTTYDDAGTPVQTGYDYDALGQVTNKREYGFQQGGSWVVRRRTHVNYTVAGAGGADVPNEVDVYDALLDNNDGNDVLVAKTTYDIDNYNYAAPLTGMENYGGTANPPGHLSYYNASYMSRGNITGQTQWTDIAGNLSITRQSRLNIFGVITIAQVSCCNQKSVTYSSADNFANAGQVTSGDPNGVHLTETHTYDFATSKETGMTDPNNLTTTYQYDSNLRPTAANLPTGATATASFSDNTLTTTSGVSWTDGGDNKSVSSTSVSDWWGHVTQAVDAAGNQVNLAYNNMGYLQSKTNPFPQNGTPGPATTYSSDALGRVTVVTLPDGNTVQTSYSGATVTVTDQVNRKIKREVDGLGRLIKVTEQDVATGALTQETTYTYDLLDKLTGVNQGGQARSYKYDAIGRLLYEKIPEQTATINDGTGTYWSCKYTYTDFGAMATKTDARGVIISYGYDTMNRLTQVTYDTAGAPGVAATPIVFYNFDTSTTTPTKGLLLSVTVGNSYLESYGYDAYNRLSSVTDTIDGKVYTRSYQLNTAGQMTQLTYPSSQVLPIAYDSIGRLSSVGVGGNNILGYLRSISYNSAGQLTGDTLGNGVSETFGYDANRMQLTTQTATASGGVSGGLMNLSYGYSAAAGQLGTGTTAGNSGQLVSISGTIGALTESANYTYDDLGRLVTSNQSSNGASAQRRFDYDRWGNRTTEWDATNGGNEIQSVALEQSGGAPTNRLQTVYPSRTNVALAANGATASASSFYSASYSESGAINGDRKGSNWGNGGGWNDNTANSYPDWLQVSFNGSKTINEIDVFTLQDNFSSPVEPTQDMAFSLYGIVDFQVQYWNGSSWQTVPGGSVTGNNKVWRKFTFSDITTDKIRVNVTNALGSYSRVTEIEAYESSGGLGTYTYDAAGNVTNDGTHNYTYDAENRLVSVDGGATASYGYDQQNQRIKKTIGSTVTHYVWQGSQVLAEHNGVTGAVITDYIYSGNRMIAKVSNVATQYFLSDRLSTRLVLDGNGNVIGRQGHLPFGDDFAESAAQEKHHFTSYERDGESGIDYAINRYNQVSLARFQQVDSLSGQTNLPQSLNRYSYGRNDPINTKDPLGLFIFNCSGSGLFPFGVTFLLDGIEIPNFCYVSIIEIGIITLPPQVLTCPVEPLEPITDPDAQRFEQNDNRVDLEHLTPDMRTAVSCFQNAVEALHGTFNITSAWRPAAYQRHLREVWDKWQLLRNNTTLQCAQVRREVQREFQNHNLVHQPAIHSDHTRGIAIDVNIAGLPRGTDVDAIGRSCALRRTVRNDPNHWALRP